MNMSQALFGQYGNSFVVLLCIALCLLGCEKPEQKQNFEPKANPEHVHDLSHKQYVPPALAGTWLRLSDRQSFQLQATDPLRGLAPGAYQVGSHIVCLRHGDKLADYALSLQGISSSPLSDKDLVINQAEQRTALNPVSQIILSWRLADNFSWPWFSQVGLFEGLSSISAKYNNTNAGFQYDSNESVYLNESGHPIRISDSQSIDTPSWGENNPQPFTTIRIGDVIAANDVGSGQSRFGILVRDQGRIGYLDPEDELMSAFVPPDKRPDAIRTWKLGYLLGPAELHIYTRHKQRALSILKRFRPDNPIWGLSKQRQWMTLAGMFIIVVVLLRRQRAFRRKQKNNQLPLHVAK